MTEAITRTRAVLLDIEGTVTPIFFVHDVLFPFAVIHVQDYLTRHSSTADVQDDIAALAREHALDHAGGEHPPEARDGVWSIDAVVAYVKWLIERDRKSPALKSLQGKIWERGYRDGTLKAPLFEDVVPNLCRLRESGLSIGIFSSGSVYAQKLLFAHTQTGDHTGLIDRYFDTSVGSKVSPASYREIAGALAVLPTEMTFISDVASELSAARDAGMATLLCVRPGNQPQSASERFQVIHNFSEILPTG
jgi:enolase-phosphatase E1